MAKPVWTEKQLSKYNRKKRVQSGQPEFENEAEFQREAELYLQSLGFMPRNDKCIQKGANTHRWYFHLSNCKRNALIADLLIMDGALGSGDGCYRCIEIEIKNGPNATLRPNQKHLKARGDIVICRNMEEFKQAVNDWISK